MTSKAARPRSQCRYSDVINAFPAGSVAAFLPKDGSRPRSASVDRVAMTRSVLSPSVCMMMPLFAADEVAAGLPQVGLLNLGRDTFEPIH
jgi:hypothetical protein